MKNKDENRFKAQDLVYDAWETDSLKDAVALARQAVKLDPLCVDALIILAQAKKMKIEDEIKEIERIVKIGADDLGEIYFRESKGSFWGILETRPYMRARTYLAQLLADADRIDEAVGHYEEMLTLNPCDNQGLRYPLIGLYLATNNLDSARDLFGKFEDEESAMFAWAQTLERFLSKDLQGAEKALTQARKANSYVEQYFTGNKHLPHYLPDSYGWGDEDEAIICADSLISAWNEHPPAVLWLKEQSRGTMDRLNTISEQVGRNDPCTCGSGQKYKKCHGA